MRERPVRAALRRMLQEPDILKRAAVAIAHAEGWGCHHDPDEAARRLRRILNSRARPGHAPRNLDCDWLPMILAAADTDEITPLLSRMSALVQVRREMKEKDAA